MNNKTREGKIEKLYTACTFDDDIDDRQDVLVKWYRRHPRRKDVDYSQLIKDYELLSESDKIKAEEIVDEYFTEEEIEVLRKFLKERSRFREHDLWVSQHSIPIQVKDDSTGEMYSSFQEASFWGCTLCPDYQHESDLPFIFFGHYNVDRRSPGDKLSRYHIWDGVAFIQLAVGIIDPDCCEEEYGQKRLEGVVSELYEEWGLFVGINDAKRLGIGKEEA